MQAGLNILCFLAGLLVGLLIKIGRDQSDKEVRDLLDQINKGRKP